MVIEPIIWRRAVREYSDEPVLDESIAEIIKAAQFAPTAHNSRAVEFVVVKKQTVKNELCEILAQDFIKKAPVLIIPISDTKISQSSEADLAVASAFMMIQAAALSLGTVWKHIPPELAGEIRKVLQIPENYNLINIVPAGYPLNEMSDHSDAEFDIKKIHTEGF